MKLTQAERKFVKFLHHFDDGITVSLAEAVAKHCVVPPARGIEILFAHPAFETLYGCFKGDAKCVSRRGSMESLSREYDTVIPIWWPLSVVTRVKRRIQRGIDWLHQYWFFGVLFNVLAVVGKTAVKGKSILSMLFMIWVYAKLWGWPFAAGFVLLLMVHETGHLYVLWRMGYKVGLPIFIPFAGAIITMKKMPKNAWVDAMIGIGGPLAGTIASLICAIVAHHLDSLLWQALAYVSFLIQIFNMMPMRPLDGGRVLSAVSKWFALFGFVLGCVALFYVQTPMLVLIVVVASAELWQVFKHTNADYFAIGRRYKALAGALYFGLLAFLLFAVHVTYLDDEHVTTVQQVGLMAGPMLHLWWSKG